MGRAIQILRGVGVLLCVLSMILALTNSTVAPGKPSPPVALTVLLPWTISDFQNLVIGVAVPLMIAVLFWRSTTVRELASPGKLAIAFLSIQTLLAFLVAEELQFVVAVEAGLLLSARAGAIWVFGQASAAWLLAAIRPELMAWIIPESGGRSKRLLGIGIFMMVAMLYNFLAFSLGLLAAMEGRQRRALEQVNQELRAAQQGVAEAARMAERLRLARELHDAIGHQMSALSIHLQVASRLSQDQARRPVLEAYQLAGLLLADIRAVVSATRAVEVTDLSGALHAIARKVEQPSIHLNLVATPERMEGHIGHTFFRCAQEVITNAVRHSGAAHIWIETDSTGDAYTMTAWDDGAGNQGLQIGNGLRGIEERIRELEGNAVFRNREGLGFEVSIRVPLSRKPAA